MHINFRVLAKTLGMLTAIEGFSMLPCIAASLHFEEWSTAGGLFVTSIFCLCGGFVLLTQLKFDELHLRSHEGYLFAFLCWVYCSFIGSLPFYFSGQGYAYVSCFFEAVAGFSTTGCSVFDIDLIPQGLLLWRSISNWLGGMGILVLLVSVFPALGISGQTIALAETTGPTFDKIGIKFSDTGQILYMTYVTFTVVEFLLLAISPLTVFDALVNTLSSVSTGGVFMTSENADIFVLPYVRVVILVFSVLSSLNYACYYFMWKGQWKPFLQNVETRFFLKTIGIATILISFSLLWSGTYTNFLTAVTDSLCQVVSFISTSGYYVCDYTQWPTFAIVILFSLLFIGGCCMSTSGSLKVIRVMVLFKLIHRGIYQQIHPNAIKAVVVEGKALSSERVSAISTHILLFFGVFFASCLVLSLNNFSMEATVTTAIGFLSNTGLSLDAYGSSGYFGMFNGVSQFFLAFLMIAGRLEIYTVLMLFSKTFWNLDRVKHL